jgi:hypothetical protein
MRPSPSIVPGIDRDIYLVLDDYGRVGRAWAETDEDHTSLGAVIADLLQGQYRRRMVEGRLERRGAGAAATLRQSGPRAARFG